MELKTAYRYRRAHQWAAWANRRVVSSGPCAVMAIDLARADVAKLATAQAAFEAASAAREAARDAAAPYLAKGYSRHTVTPPEAGEMIRRGEETESAYQSALKAASAARRPSYGPPSPACLTWQERDADGTPRKRAERLAYVEKPDAFGLRFVGRVTPESYGGRDTFSGGDSVGWYTDPFGDTFRDGTGLCYGVVYQLPGRRGVARFVAGYEFGGTDGGPCLDLGNIFESESMRGADTTAQDHDDARDAARVADSMAQHAAESERDYQTAWAAGSAWAQLGEEITAERRAALALIGEFKAVRHTFAGAANVANLCAAIREKIDSALESIREARDKRAELAAGDADSLCFYPDARLKAAFCEAAGIDAFPA